MQLIFDTPEFFFYDLITKSKRKHSIQTDDNIDAYLVSLLSTLATGEYRFNMTDPLSILYLQACQTHDSSLYRVVGDSSLLFLGFFPSQSIKHSESLYRNLGISSYDALQDRLFQKLAYDFDKAVQLLFGAQLLLEGENILPLRKRRC